jgi:hypothetical protein
MSEPNFVSLPTPTDLTNAKASSAGEPTLNTSALRAAAMARLNNPTPSDPAPSSQGQPSTQGGVPGAEPVSPLHQTQIPVTVKDASPRIGETSPTAAQTPIPDDQKVAVTDPNTGAKTEVNILDLPDDAIIRMKVNGEPVTMSAKEAREGMMKGAKFTREMQNLRQQETEFAGRLENATKLEQLIGDDAALASYIFQAKPHIVETLAEHMGWTKAQAASALASTVNAQAAAPVQPTPSPYRIERPEEIASLGEVDQLVGARVAEVLGQVEALKAQGQTLTPEAIQGIVAETVGKAVKSEIGRLQNAHEVAAFDGEINKTVTGILDANPALKHVPGIESVLRFEVIKLRPKSPSEMMEAFHTVAQGIVEGLDETYKAARKTTVIDKATMEKTGIQPPTGTAPSMSRPINYQGQDGKVDFNLIRQAAKAALRSA